MLSRPTLFLKPLNKFKNQEYAKMMIARFPLFLVTTISPNFLKPSLPLSHRSHRKLINMCATVSTQQPSSSSPPIPISTNTNRWKPLCLYYTHGKCTKMDDPSHIETFTHDCSSGLRVNAEGLERLQTQPFDFLLVLDLEGKEEILEFPVIMIDTRTLEFVDFFHRFVRPVKMSEKRIEEYIKGKYGGIGVDRVWHDTAIPFTEVLQEFEVWMTQKHLWERETGGSLRRAAFVTCGNWDVKTKVPQQCKDSSIELPSYFLEWINLKDIYLNFYKSRAPGMRSMMNQLGIPLLGSHHLGIDDSKNIVRVMQRMLSDGAVMQLTAKWSADTHKRLQFFFKDRV